MGCQAVGDSIMTQLKHLTVHILNANEGTTQSAGYFHGMTVCRELSTEISSLTTSYCNVAAVNGLTVLLGSSR